MAAPDASRGSFVEFYGLKELPFCSTPDPRFVFPGRSFSLASTRALQALHRRDGLIVVTGRSGVGKTALCRFVLQHMTGPHLVSYVADPFLSPDELLRQVIRDFDAVSDEELEAFSPARTSCHDLLVILHRFLVYIAPRGTTVAIVIDDAHNLQRRTLEQIRALSNLESDAGKLLQIVLIGEPRLDALLQEPEAFQLGDRVGCRIRLEPLSRSEVGQYVDYRLQTARSGRTGPGRAQFSHSAIRMLTRVSCGIPRALNALCDRSLSIGSEFRAESITRRIALESGRQLRLPIPLTARYPRARDVAAALLAAAILALPLIRLERAVQKPLLAFVSQRKATLDPRPGAEAAHRPALAPVLPPANPMLPAGTRDASGGSSRPAPLQAADSYIVVVASFKSPRNASVIAEQLERFGLPAFAREDQAAGWHVVLVGPYASPEEAQEARRQLAIHNFANSLVHVQRH